MIFTCKSYKYSVPIISNKVLIFARHPKSKIFIDDRQCWDTSLLMLIGHIGVFFNSFCRWKTVSLWILWEVLQCEGLSHETHTHTHRRKAVHLSVLWQTIYAAQCTHCAHDKAASALGSAQRGAPDSSSWPKETMRYGLKLTKKKKELDGGSGGGAGGG